LAAQGGANLIYGAGMLDLGITFDFAQFVIDNEIYTMIRKVIDGIKITDEALAVDLIKEVGPGGELVSHPHTFANFRAEQSATSLFDRSMREAWIAEGCKDLAERAYAKADDILRTHQVPALAAGVENEIHDILLEAEEKYGM
jgi:trimethylamine--corrinoid protein Co-methyltransferase